VRLQKLEELADVAPACSVLEVCEGAVLEFAAVYQLTDVDSRAPAPLFRSRAAPADRSLHYCEGAQGMDFRQVRRRLRRPRKLAGSPTLGDLLELE